MATINLLNPRLHAAMEKNFGRVKIVNHGMPLNVIPVPRYYYNGKRRLNLQISDYGETYLANCPVCTDTRQRMYVNNQFGLKNAITGRRNLELVKCFNENCFSMNYERRKRLHGMLYPDDRYADEMPALSVKPVVATVPAAREVSPLPESIRLDRLAPNHRARVFVERRGLDPDMLAAEFGVGYFDGDKSSSPTWLKPALIVPVWSPGVLVNPATGEPEDTLAGWQARLLCPRPGESKYMTASGLKTGSVLYNLPQAARSDGPLVVVEGVSDVWAVGKNAVALFGKTIQPRRASLLAEKASGRPVVVWLDAEAKVEAKRVADAIRTVCRSRSVCSRVLIAQCPDHREDPGECTPDEVRCAIDAAMASG